MRLRSAALLIVGLILLFTAAAPVHGAPQPAQGPGADFVEGELILVFKESNLMRSFSLPQGAQAAQDAPRLDALNAMVVSVPAGKEEQYRKELMRSESVLFAEPNYLVRAVDTLPDDPLWGASDYQGVGQWDMARIHAPAAWDVTQGSGATVLAVLDSGLDSSHPEFAGRLLPGYDFIENDATPQDQCGHGTHVTGIAAATGNNAQGIAGVDWNTRILPVRVLDRTCTGDIAGVVKGLVWAVDVHGADVINMSIGTGGPSRLLEYGTYYAYQRGATLIAAAGNTGSNLLYPARYPWVLAVGFTNLLDARDGLSAYGPQLDLVAPGASILSTLPYTAPFFYQGEYHLGNRYGVLSGSSMAAPHVAGTAALLAGRPGYNHPDQLYAALTQTAEDLGVPGFDEQTGYGMLRVDLALAYDPAEVLPPSPPAARVEYDLLSSSRCANIRYSWREIPHGFSDYLPIFGNDAYATVTLPFSFELGGRAFSEVTVSANGYLSFDGYGGEAENFIIPTATGKEGFRRPDWFLAPFWDDLNPSALSQAAIYHATLGSSPNRQYVVEWHRVPIQAYNTTSELTFQVVLFEGSNQALFQYRTLKGPGSSGDGATVGIEYDDGYRGLQYAYNRRGALMENQAILFVPHPPGDSSGVPGCLTEGVIGPGGGSLAFEPFCLEAPAGALAADTRVHFTVFNRFSPLPSGRQNLNRFADIILDPMPRPPLDPPPEVCYYYTAQDVLQAGGRPQNLLFMVYDAETRRWDALPTQVDLLQQRIVAPVPHFSVFGVFAPGSAVPETPPVTGAPRPPWRRALLLVLGLGALGGVAFLWRRL